MPTNQIIFDVIWHYDEDDKRFLGDYYGIEVFFEGKKIIEFGDGYHDEGRDKLRGFMRGVEWHSSKKVILNERHVADGMIIAGENK